MVRITGVITNKDVYDSFKHFTSVLLSHFITFVDFIKYFICIGILEFITNLE